MTYTTKIDEPTAYNFRITFARDDGGHFGTFWFSNRSDAERAAADFAAHLRIQRLETLATPSFWARGIHS